MLGTTVAIGLGSNLGSSVDYLRQALAKLKLLKSAKVLSVSSIYESEAQTPDGAPAGWNKKYLNAAVLLEISPCEPLDLLAHLKNIETELGRKTTDAWAPREIDLDILFWSRADFASPQLNIPHARLLERPFALLPLMEVWPEIQTQLQAELPLWAKSWVQDKPFNTKISEHVWPKLVGILNVTPDSFSDGGKLAAQSGNYDALLAQLQLFKNTGTKIIDIGAESTRPQAKSVNHEEELARLRPAFDVINEFGSDFEISLDCRNPEVAAVILAKYQVNYLNDVTGFESPGMQKLLKQSGLRAFVMHSLGVPPTKEHVLSDSCSPCELLTEWWARKLAQLENAGIGSDRLIFDPGIGFGKTARQNLYILNHLIELADIKNEIMIGHSRKSFLSLLSARPAAERDLETAVVTGHLNLAFTQYLRIHDPASQLAALQSKGQML